MNPLILRSLIDNGIAEKNQELVIWLGVLVAVLAIADGALALTERRISANLGESLIYDMRSKVFRHIQRMPLAFFTRTQTGALVSRLNNDVIGAQQAFTDLLSNVVGNLVTVVIVIAAMFFLSWQITLAALLLVPLFLIPGAGWDGVSAGADQEGYDLNAEMNMVMQERFQVGGAMLVKLMGRPEAEAVSFDDKAGRVRDIGIAQATYSRVFFVALSLTASLATAIVYGAGGVAAIKGELQVGTVVALASYLTRLYQPLTQLSNLNLDVMTALVSFERLFEVLDIVPMIDEAPDAVDVPRVPASIEFDDVHFTYPSVGEVSLASLESVSVLESGQRHEILHGISFRVEPGTMVALVGPSGAGKTTISNLVPRLYDVTSGSVRVDGVDVREATMASLRDVVGVVTQDPHLFHDTLRANLLYARPDSSESDLLGALAQAQIGHIVGDLPDGLDTVIGERGYRLSGGEKQRVALARLMLKAPDIVVLDEATAHLDSESEAAVQQALRETLSGRTSLVIAHRLSTVREADQLLVVDDGRIVEGPTPDCWPTAVSTRTSTGPSSRTRGGSRRHLRGAPPPRNCPQSNSTGRFPRRPFSVRDRPHTA